MLAVVLFAVFGSQVALTELLAELVLGLIVLGGGGRKRMRLVLRAL